jgi:Cyclin
MSSRILTETPCLCRIHKYASCSNECFILALIYIDRLIQRNNMLLSELNVHRVVVTAVLLAAKFFDDAYYNNAYYAKVGGVLVSELNGLEVDFLFRINFSLHVPPEEFEKYRCELMSRSEAVSAVTPPTGPLHSPLPTAPKVYNEVPPVCIDTDRRTTCYHSSPVSNRKAHITPSPPSTAAAVQMVEALVSAVNSGSPDPFYSHLGFVFPPAHRTHSMPPSQKTVSSPVYHHPHVQQQQRQQSHSDPIHSRCSRPMSAMPQFPAPDDMFGMMIQQQLYPSGTTATPLILHHHHGHSFHHHPVPIVDASTGYVVVSMSDRGL